MQAAPGLFVELVSVGFEVGNERLAVGQPLGWLAQAVDLELDAGETQLCPEVAGQHDEFGVHIGTGEAQGLGAELVELPVAAPLRPLVTEHRPHVIKALATVVEQ